MILKMAQMAPYGVFKNANIWNMLKPPTTTTTPKLVSMSWITTLHLAKAAKDRTWECVRSEPALRKGAIDTMND